MYLATAGYGHFGRSQFSWEKTHRAAQLAADLLGGKPSGKKVDTKKAHVNGNGANGTNGALNGHAAKDSSAAKDKGAKKAKKGKKGGARFAEA